MAQLTWIYLSNIKLMLSQANEMQWYKEATKNPSSQKSFIKVCICVEQYTYIGNRINLKLH